MSVLMIHLNDQQGQNQRRHNGHAKSPIFFFVIHRPETMACKTTKSF